MRTRVDHLVIAATDIDRGADWAERMLGVRVPVGGVHPAMGTHNHLMRLGDEMFLEVIAINPDGAVPDKPRWFGMDDPSVRQRLEREPAFLAWVANTDDIHGLLDAAPISFGRATPVTRGSLNWQFALPSDGRLLAGDASVHHPVGDRVPSGRRHGGFGLPVAGFGDSPSLSRVDNAGAGRHRAG